MHRVSWLAIVFAVGAMAVGACGDSGTVPPPPAGVLPDSAIHGVFVEPGIVTIQAGSKATLTGSVDRGAAAPDLGVAWSSADTTVAIVDQHGLLTAVRPGATTVTATSVADPKFTGSAKIVVLATSMAAVRAGPRRVVGRHLDS
jgi:hypothetical protein